MLRRRLSENHETFDFNGTLALALMIVILAFWLPIQFESLPSQQLFLQTQNSIKPLIIISIDNEFHQTF